MNKWLKCKYGHVFHENTNTICPKCEVEESSPVPVEVSESVKKFTQRRGVSSKDLMESMAYYKSMGCYGFTLSGVFYGVENDGHLHS